MTAAPSPVPAPDAEAAFARLVRLAVQTKAPALADREARLIVAEWRRAWPASDPAVRRGIERLMELLDGDAAGAGQREITRSGAETLALEAAGRALAEEWRSLGPMPDSPAPSPVASAAPHACCGAPWMVALVLVCVALVLGLLLNPILGYKLVGVVFLVPVLACSRLFGRQVALFATMIGALCWNFLFFPPVYTFYIAPGPDQVAYGLFVAGSATCWLFARR